MLSIERTRELIGKPEMSDKEVTEIRNALFEMADLVVDCFIEKQMINQANDSP